MREIYLYIHACFSLENIEREREPSSIHYNVLVFIIIIIQGKYCHFNKSSILPL